MNFAHLRAFDSDELYRGVKHLEELQATEGWKFLRGILVAQQSGMARTLSAPPGRGESADQFALKVARAGGTVEALQFAFDAPEEILKVARSELEARQREVAEQAAREEQ